MSTQQQQSTDQPRIEAIQDTDETILLSDIGNSDAWIQSDESISLGDVR